MRGSVGLGLVVSVELASEVGLPRPPRIAYQSNLGKPELRMGN